LADFIARANDYIGAFALTTGHGLEKIVKEFEDQNDDYNAIMAKVLVDRLAEAFAERMHERVRKEFWGYVPEEHLSNRDLIKENTPGFVRLPATLPAPIMEKKIRFGNCST